MLTFHERCDDFLIVSSFPSPFPALQPFSPAEVDLSGNRLTTLSEIAALPIQNFTASNCEIEVIDHGAFKQLTDTLVILDLGSNKLSTTSLDMRVFMVSFFLLQILYSAISHQGRLEQDVGHTMSLKILRKLICFIFSCS